MYVTSFSDSKFLQRGRVREKKEGEKEWEALLYLKPDFI